MDAIISGSAGVAIFVDDHKLASIHSEAPAKTIPRQPEDLRFLLGDTRDLLVVEDVSQRDVMQQLKNAQEMEESLHLFLILLDSDLSTSVRQEAARVLADLLKQPHVTEQLECLFFAQELPKGIDLQASFRCCQEAKAKLTQNFLQRLIKVQPYVLAVRRQWDSIPTASFGTDEEIARLHTIFIKEGLFRKLVQSISLGATVDEFILESLLNPSVKAFPNNRKILLQWTNLFRPDKPFPAISQEKTDDYQLITRRKRDKNKRFSGDREEILNKVERQKEAIVTAMDSHNLRRIHKYTKGLIKYQMEHGGAKFACKSLCDLAMVAKESHMHDIQLKLTEQSVSLKPDDGWSLAQYADALLCTNKPHESLTAYENALTFGKYLIAQAGRAGALKTLNRLDEALAVYDEIIAEYPYEVVPQNGKAEVLKSLNRLDEALVAYDKIIAEHPYDAVAKTGRAEVLKSLNRLDEALAAYDKIIAEYPYEVVPQNGKAEVLKSLNRLDEALAAYDKIIAEHSYDVFAKNGRAEVLKFLNRLDEALVAYDKIIAEHPYDAVAKTGRAEVLKSLNRLDEALVAYEKIIAEYPYEVVPQNGKAEVLKSLNRLDEALAAYDKIIAEHSYDVFAKTGRAEVLKSLNRLDEALVAYDKIIAEHPYDIVPQTGRAEVLKSLNRLDEALVTYDKVIAEHPYDIVPQNGRAEVLKSLNRLDEALAAYDKIIAEHSYDVFAKNGRAEVLKFLNRLDEALVAYDKIIAEHPYDAVAQTGRAEVLKFLNRLDEALVAYEKIIAEYPYDTVAKNGRACVLATMEREDEALVAYEKIIAENPYDTVAKNGRACVLAAMEREDEALLLLPDKNIVTKEEWIGYHIRGMVLLHKGELDLAIRIFEKGVRDNPRPADRDYFRTALAVAHLHEREYEPASNVLDGITTPMLQTPANILRIHAFGRRGDCERTAEIYKALPSKPGPVLAELQSELYCQYVACETPRHNEDWLIDKEIHYILLAA